MNTAQAVFDRERLQWPQALVPKSGFERLRSAVPLLPEFCTGLFLECHLDDPQRTDVAARLYPDDRDALLDRGVSSASFRRFLSAWGDPSDPAHRLPAADVEVDLVDVPDLPFVCPSFGRLLLVGNEAFNGTGAAELALYLLHVLWPETPQELVEAMQRLRSGVPRSVVVLPGWPLVSRGDSPGRRLRAQINVSHWLVPGMLRDLGWSGDLERLQRVIGLVCRSRPWASLDVDVTCEGISDRIGVGYDALWVRPTDRTLQVLLDGLQETGWCQTERLLGLREWVGARQLARDGEWKALTIKIVLTADGCPKPKAYLSTFDVGR